MVAFYNVFGGISMKEERHEIVCGKCGHKFSIKTEDGEWECISDNQFGYVDAIGICPKCRQYHYFPVVNEKHNEANNYLLTKLELLKVHPAYIGMMLNI